MESRYFIVVLILKLDKDCILTSNHRSRYTPTVGVCQKVAPHISEGWGGNRPPRIQTLGGAVPPHCGGVPNLEPKSLMRRCWGGTNPAGGGRKKLSISSWKAQNFRAAGAPDGSRFLRSITRISVRFRSQKPHRFGAPPEHFLFETSSSPPSGWGGTDFQT